MLRQRGLFASGTFDPSSRATPYSGILFGENTKATGVELTEDILLRLDEKGERAVSLTLMHFSVLAELTEYGPRSYRLGNLEEISEDLRELVLRLMTSMPVQQFLKLSHFQASPDERIPFTYVESQPIVMAA